MRSFWRSSRDSWGWYSSPATPIPCTTSACPAGIACPSPPAAPAASAPHPAPSASGSTPRLNTASLSWICLILFIVPTALIAREVLPHERLQPRHCPHRRSQGAPPRRRPSHRPYGTQAGNRRDPPWPAAYSSHPLGSGLGGHAHRSKRLSKTGGE